MMGKKEGKYELLCKSASQKSLACKNLSFLPKENSAGSGF
jgi:hypothetical protein